MDASEWLELVRDWRFWLSWQCWAIVALIIGLALLWLVLGVIIIVAGGVLALRCLIGTLSTKYGSAQSQRKRRKCHLRVVGGLDIDGPPAWRQRPGEEQGA